MKISLIMPVYNAAETLPVSLQSLREQRNCDLEVIFVDDCSSDASPAMLAAFSAQSGLTCRTVRQPENRGVAAARNRGLEAATGEYIGFLDADDRLEAGALERMTQILSEAGENVDILGWDWTLGFEKNGRRMRQADYADAPGAIENLMGGTMRWNLWLFLLRRDLIEKNGLRFLEGANMGEDMQFMIRAFLHAGNVRQIHDTLYRYNAVSSTSISRQFSRQRRAEIERNVREVERAIRESAFREQLEPRLDALKLFLKRPLLIGADPRNYEIWYRWFPEANAAAMRNRKLPLRIRLLQGMAARRWWKGVRFHYRFVYQFVYGILYR